VPGRGGIRVGKATASSPARIGGRRGVVVNGERYPGSLELRSAGGRLDVINHVDFERYVVGIIANEVYPHWPAEVLKAQAVIARTYALHEISKRAGEPFHVEATVLSQRYRGSGVPARVERAARETEGEHLEFGGSPILAVYHSSAGGRTASAEEVWGEEVPYLAAVASPDDDAPDFFWSYEIGKRDLAAALRERGISGPTHPEVEVLERGPSGRVKRIRIGDAALASRDLRKLLGGAAIRSTLFEVRQSQDRVRFLGSGSGHGVGLSQWGALALAEKGESYRQILAHYYPGCRLARGSLAQVGAR
jgi:stage II sporulation protein D